MKFKPKDYQVEARRKLAMSIREGNSRIVLQASTGTGKTYIAAWIIEGALAKGKRIVFVAPYTTLIDQTIEKLIEQGIPHGDIAAMQGNHELTNPNCRVQVATAQTLGRRQRPICDIVIVDECHLMYKSILSWMEEAPETLFIGLSATPWAKGMGKYYTDHIKIKSLSECLDDGTLSPYKLLTFGNPDMSKVGVQGGDYKQNEAADVLSAVDLVADITTQWLARAENRQTIAFCMNVLHANKVANDLSSAGIPVEVITAKTPLDERTGMFKRFEDRQTRILVSVGCLVAGFDSYVDCIIWAVRTKSRIKFIQGNGRGLRTAPGKEHCLILDHSGTFCYELGFLEDVDASFDGLDSGDPKESKAAAIEREEKIQVPKPCPAKDCNAVRPAGVHECPECGFIPRHGVDVDVDRTQELHEVTRGKKKKKEATKEEKQKFYSELLGWQKQSVKKKVSDGYVANLYKQKFNVWPRSLDKRPVDPTPELLNYIKSRRIAYAKSKAAS